MRVAWVFILIAFVMGGVVLAWRYLDERQATQEHDSSSRTIERDRNVERFFAQEPVDVTAKQLIKLWRSNEVAARERYLGRPLRIDGHVERVTVERVDDREFPVLYFSEGGACAFNWGEPQPELARLHRGQRVVVLGQPRGPWSGVEHLTTHCTLESLYE